jgi:hypothetical protein
VDHGGRDESVLVFEAPTLGEAAPELYEPQESWPTRPDPDDTGFDLLGDVLSDVASDNEDSDRFDQALLGRLARFQHVLNGTFRDLSLRSRRYGDSSPARINPGVIATARRFQETTPPPQRVRVVGTLDMIRASTQSFALHLDDSQEVRGVLVSGAVVEVAPLLGKRVLALGRAIYRASGRLLRIDADAITSGEGEPSFWSRIPAPRTRRLNPSSLHVPQGPRSGLSTVIGRWPGDETDEEIAAWLEWTS